jgi:peptidoglycan-associated lipoprotein
MMTRSKTMQTTIRAIALLLFLVLAGCATAPQDRTETTTEDADSAAETDTGTGAETDGMGEEEGARRITAEECPPDCPFTRDAIEDSSGLLADRTIYFEFDSSSVQEEFMDTIRRHASYLADYADVDVRLEGHTDERGSREYNVGLGARRAEAVSRLLQAYGASSRQIETISYGEEVPAVEGSNEEAWAKNRRVEIVYPASGGSN